MSITYNFREIEKKWQKFWKECNIFKTEEGDSKPKCYVLDMFPYPSGAGLHVGHPLGYVASDIFARYKKMNGYNVLHPMGFDTFGLPAEQYAIETGQHPKISTDINIKRYKQQLQMLGLSYDWSREVITSDPNYYKWTQWIFMQFFNHYYDKKDQKAKPISDLIKILEKKGNTDINIAQNEDTPKISHDEWSRYNEKEKQQFLLNFRLAYIKDSLVNWCPELKTVLANDEIANGISKRGGHPVYKKKMKQWYLRISAYAERLLDTQKLDWSDSLKTVQKNWIGKSRGAIINFKIKNKDNEYNLEIYTTKPETIFGVTFLALSYQHPLLKKLNLTQDVRDFILKIQSKSEIEKAKSVGDPQGTFIGYYGIHPLTNELVPIYIVEYVLAEYGTGSIMGVPAHDTRDENFAKKYNIEIKPVIQDYEEKYENGIIINSEFLNGIGTLQAKEKIIQYIIDNYLGYEKINYKLRDATLSRQRYWGEPIPIYYSDGIPYLIPENELPLKLPEVENYLPTNDGDPPLGNAKEWKITPDNFPRELSTMPGWAGSSWYFLKYMDPHNLTKLVSKEKSDYWNSVDLYIGGSEHSVGHLLYARFWTMFFYDLGIINFEEPFKKLVNQGMIQSFSKFVYRIKDTKRFVSYNLKQTYDTSPIHVDVSIVDINNKLDIEKFKNWRKEFNDAEFILENGEYICGSEIEKMSKSKYNVVNPDKIIKKYGSDSLRMYLMFLGPIRQSKPWQTNGIEGIFKFLNKLHKTIKTTEFDNYEEEKEKNLKTIHKTIKKIKQDIENLSLNTSISEFMICLNELISSNCKSRKIYENLLKCLAPFAPHLSEELWEFLGNKEYISYQKFPDFDEKYIQEDTFFYPISINGKVRTRIEFSIDNNEEEIKRSVLKDVVIKKWIQDRSPKKIIVIRKKIVNIVI